MEKQAFILPKKYLLIFAVCILISVIAGATVAVFSSNFNSPFSKTEQTNTDIAQEIVNKCQATGERCYSDEFGKLTEVEPAETSIAVLAEVNNMDPNSRGCHLIAHSISIAETLKDINKWKEVLGRVPTDKCTGGYLHGIFEARQTKDPTLLIDENTIPENCEVVQKASNGGTDQDCAHIMGHLLVVVKGGDLQEAINTCDMLPENLQYECHSGVFMENETRESMVGHGISDYIPWNDETTGVQQELCEKQTGIASKACWREISHMYGFIANDYPPEMFRLCAQAADVNNVTDCYMHGVGIITVSNRFDEKNLAILCAPFSRLEDYAACIDMAMGSMMTSSIHFADRVKTMCSVIPENFKTGCYERFGEHILKLAGAQALPAYCDDVKFPYRDYCEKPYL